MSNKKMNKWDEKAKNYARYSPCKNSFEANVLEALKKTGIDFKDKTILDIGCGTGVYTIRIAKVAKSVDGLDFSANMLQILKEDAQSLDIKNIKTYHTTWADFDIKDTIYDIALCTMSPAIKLNSDLEKFHLSAKKKIYLGWAGVRNNTVLDDLFLAHNSIYTPPNGAKRVKKWLYTKSIKYQLKNFEELKIKVRCFEEAVENYTWHLKIRGLEPNTEKIKKILGPLRNEDGKITEQTINKMDLIIW
ncbi:MAG: class I SAM-dependent methyltransferase [Sulfurospirillum sp.]